MDIIAAKDAEIARLRRVPDDLLHAGIGITFDKDVKKFARVTSVLKDGSAWRDGRIQEGDEIVKIDGNDVLDWTYEQLNHDIFGPYGTPIDVTVQQCGSSALIDVRLGTCSA
jgi:C-terminal processing protease CtpA/Prc